MLVDKLIQNAQPPQSNNLPMKHLLKLSLFFILFYQEAYSQKSLRNNVYGEALGFAGHYSVNYERFQPLLKNRAVLLGLNAGFCLEQYRTSKGFAIPMGIKLCVGWKGVYGEVGGDYLFLREKEPDYFHGGFSSLDNSKFKFFHLGIRYQPEKSRLFIRAFMFPLKVRGTNGILLFYYGKPDFFELRDQGKSHVWWGGLDIGYSF